MAAAPPPMEMEQEVMCPICLECLTDPVVLDCGHSFCQGCITKYCEACEALGEAPECPTCKAKIQKGNFRRNWQLANLLEKMKLIPLSSGKEDLCLRHKEKLHFFCIEDERLLCFVCERSPEHKGHKIILLEEAAQHYKDKIFNCLETLRTEREKILAYYAAAEEERQVKLKKLESRRQKTMTEFRALRQMLDEQEERLLAQIEEVEKEVARKRDEHLAKLSEELSSLESLIQEMEEKHQQPVSELLQDVRSTLQRYEKKEPFENPKTFPSELKRRLWDCCYHPFLDSAMKQFNDTLAWAFPEQRAYVNLDPASASFGLLLSKNQKCMTWQSTAQNPSDMPGKCYGFVLGSEGYTAGCHFWELKVGSEDGWAVGVARKSVKGRVTFTPEEGIWAVGKWKGRYRAFIKTIDPPLTLSGDLRLIRVCLNYDVAQVAFFDAERATLLYEFSEASFSSALVPFFAVYGEGNLWLSP